MTITRVIIGVDVGGTNTDAVILEGKKVISKAKTSTTSDVRHGVQTAIHKAIINSKAQGLTLGIRHVNIGTTHFINAMIEGKHMAKVSVLRLCGSSSRKLPPYSDFPAYLVEKIKGSVFMVKGGYQFDGKPINDIDEDEIKKCIAKMKSNGERHLAVCGIFSPLRNEQEIKVRELVLKEYPDASVTLSHTIGKIGLLERENAAILNETIKPLCSHTIRGFRDSLDELGLHCPLYLTQNDGTVIREEHALEYPVFTFASGSTNSMRGAAFLSGLTDALVVDIGGTSSDVGILQKGFPREKSSEIHIGGIRTNFRMPDVISIGLGGGSYAEKLENGKIKVGPQSAGYKIQQEALVFAEALDDVKSRSVTATDLATASGIVNIGNKTNVAHLDNEFVKEGMKTMNEMLTRCIDEMRLSTGDLPLILVGGGSIIVDRNSTFEGVSSIVSPDHFDVANAVGAALSQVSFSVDKIIDLGKYLSPRTNTTTTDEAGQENEMFKETLLKARQSALEETIIDAQKQTVAAGASEDSLLTVEKEHNTLAYIPGNAVRVQVKIVGDLQLDDNGSCEEVPGRIYDTEPKSGTQTHKQTITGTGKVLSDEQPVFEIKSPVIDEMSGEWIINEYDIECFTIGTGILGCGGGGSPHLARLIALQALADGKKMRVATPSKFWEKADIENDRVGIVAFMGAPLAVYEKLVANETSEALKGMKDLYRVGQYNDGMLHNEEHTEVETGDGVTFINDYQRHSDGCHSKGSVEKNITGLMSAEIGGMNGMEPLIVAADLGLPVLDCDGMGRAYPELQMFAPFIYGCKPYPAVLTDAKGQRAVVLKAESPKHVENHFRNVVIGMGCSGGLTMSNFTKSDVMNKTVLHSMSHAWRLGDAVIKARSENRSPVDAVVNLDNGVYLIYGKVVDVLRETTGGFNKGHFQIKGLDEFVGKKIEIGFQNEFLLATDITTSERCVLACTPDLITCMDADTAQPIPTEEVRFGIRVAVVVISINPLMGSEEAQKVVGPAAFGYAPDAYKPLGRYVDHEPVAPK